MYLCTAQMYKRGHMKASLLTILMISNVYGSVWETTQDWDDNYREQFQEWISSHKVKTDMFTDKNSRYYGIKADCADVTYALSAIFAYENGLPYKVKNPVFKSGHKFKYWSNEINRFNNYQSGDKRLIAFVNFLGNSLGTETLNVNDSYPLKIDSISPGDFFAFKKRQSSGGFLRHAYNIKDVLPTGNFQLIWSNQQRKKEGRPMKQAEMNLSNRPYKYSWGFRRVKTPEQFAMNKTSIEHYSSEQFELAKQYDDKKFFKHVKDSLKLYDEDPNDNLKRQIKNICNQANERIGVIASGEKFRQQIGGKCMDYNQFDEYSTPSRDGQFLKLFNNFSDTYKEFENEGKLSRVDEKTLDKARAILGKSSSSNDYCSIQYKAGSKKITLNEIYTKLISGELSSHPNDNIDRRWGVKVGKKTTCKKWY